MAEQGLMSTVFIVTKPFDVIALTASVSGSMFIIAVNLQDWIKNKYLNVSDQLIIWISVSNMSYGLMRVIGFILQLNSPDGFGILLRKKLYMIFNFAILSCNLWLCTWLCVHFCLKILNLQKRFYVTLQNGLSAIFPWIPIPSLLGSWLLSIPFFWYRTCDVQSRKLVNNCLQNASMTVAFNKSLFPYYVVYGIVSSLAFLILSTSALSIVVSLGRHMKTMKDNAQGRQSASIKIHVHAVKTIISLLTLNVFNYVAATVSLYKVSEENIVSYCSIATNLGLMFFPVILMKAKSNLYKTLKSIIFCPCINSPAI